MPFYHKLGQLPHKRHTQYRKPDGGLYREEVMGLEGFSSLASILYHNFIPPRVKHVEDLGSRMPETVDFGPIRHRAFRTADAPLGTDPVSARIPLLANRDVILGVSRASQSMDYFYRNAQAYETWWVHEGSGTLKSQFGNLKFRKGDYIVIPFGTTWQLQLDNGEARFFTIENPSQIEPPKRYRNEFGQMLEHAPYSERDIRVPEELETHTERGEFEVRGRKVVGGEPHVLQQAPGRLQEEGAFGGGFDRARGPVEQPRAQAVLQRPDQRAEGRLRQMATRGRAGEAALLRQRDKGRELPGRQVGQRKVRCGGRERRELIHWRSR